MVNEKGFFYGYTWVVIAVILLQVNTHSRRSHYLTGLKCCYLFSLLCIEYIIKILSPN